MRFSGHLLRTLWMAAWGACIVFASPARGQGLAEEPGRMCEPVPKSLQRRYDPVVVQGEVMEAMEGVPIASLRVFAFRQGAMTPIPFQVDERDPEGQYVLTAGQRAGQDADKGLFDYNDELVFMAEDAGDKAPPQSLPQGASSWVEIEISDPLRPADRAWVYVCAFDGEKPPLSPVRYVHYLPEQEQIYSDHYKVGYRRGYSLYSDLFYPNGDGTFGPDLMDRIKIRIEVKFLFSVIRVHKNEDDFRAEVVGWKEGPIRVLRDVESYVRVLFKLSSPSVFAVTEYYPYHMYTPLRLTIPFDLKWVFSKFGISDWYWKFYGDLPGLEGGLMYTNRNLRGIRIESTKDPKWKKEAFDPRYLVWGYATKEGVGTWFCNLVIPDPGYQYVQCYLNVDHTRTYPPEDVPGEVAGGALVNFRDVDPFLWTFLSKGTYELGLETFFAPAGFKPEGVEEWRNIRQFPLMLQVVRHHTPGKAPSEKAPGQTRSGGREGAGDRPVPQKGYVVTLTDTSGKSRTLYDVEFHIGSILTTPRFFVIGQDLERRTWHRVDFDEMKTVETTYRPKDPVTGMERPLIARILKKDGQTLELMACKPCGLSGYLPNGRKVFYWATQMSRAEFVEAGQATCTDSPQ